MWQQLSQVEPVASAAASDRFQSRQGRRLGNNVKSIDRAASDRRLRRAAEKRQASVLASQLSEKTGRRLSCCGMVGHAGCEQVSLRRRADGSAYLGGVMRCGSVWLCPECSPRIAAARCEELNAALAASRVLGMPVAMVTFTVRHCLRDDLSALLVGLKGAVAAFGQSKGWRGLGLTGCVTATELTHGKNGWHPHMHRLVFGVPGHTEAQLLADLESLRSEWTRAGAKNGLETGHAAAFDVQGASQAGAYVAKFGAAEEITLTGQKVGKAGGSRSPWQLLADATEGDKRAGALWVAYARAFKGRRQLVWSRGLKALFGVNEVDDEQAAQEPEAQADVILKSWHRASDEWKAARLRRCSILDAVEQGKCWLQAELGPTDAERWRRSQPSFLAVIE